MLSRGARHEHLHVGRRERVDTDAVRRPFEGQRPGHHVHAALGDVVRRDVLDRDIAGDRRVAGDRTAAAGDHHLGGGLGEEEVGLQIDVEDEVEISLGVVDRRGCGVDAGVVDQDVDAPKACGNLADDPVDLGLLRCVAGHDQAFASGGANGRCGFVELGDGSAGHGDIGAVLGKADGDGSTEPTPSAGDQCLLAGEIEQG